MIEASIAATRSAMRVALDSSMGLVPRAKPGCARQALPGRGAKGNRRMESTQSLRAASAGLVLDIANGWANLTDYSDCPIHFLGVFAALSAHGGEMPMQHLVRATGRSGSSITRTVVKLGAGSFRAPGYGWVEAYEDPQWRRRKLVPLMESGRHVAVRLLDLVAHGVEQCSDARAVPAE